MAICSFVGHPNIYDIEIDEMLQTAVNKLVEEHDFVEFLIYYQSEFSARCVLAVCKAKTRWPEKVKVTLAISKASFETGGWFFGWNRERLASCLFDEIAILDEPHCKKNDMAYGFRQSMQEIMDKSTHIVTYVYENFFGRDDRLIKYAYKRTNTEIIEIAKEETRQAIMAKIDLMNTREKQIFDRVSGGEKFKDIAVSLGISRERCSQGLGRGCRRVRTKISEHCHNWLMAHDRLYTACGIFGISQIEDNAMADFMRTAKFLIAEYKVRTFFVGESCAQSEYICELRSYSSKYTPLRIIAVSDKDVFEETGETEEHGPYPCHAIEYICRLGPVDDLSVIRELVERATFCVFDRRIFPFLPRIQRRLTESGSTVLLDIGKVPVESNAIVPAHLKIVKARGQKGQRPPR